ncbi:MAG: hypothetical protein JW793_15520 [Acidobacteria bacterium]|nr:hypothetical protein [Acidobacteriota bacterium]
MIETGNAGIEANGHPGSTGAVSCGKARAAACASAAVVMKRISVLVSVVASLLAVPLFAGENKEPVKEKEATALTEEEKEMMKDREILENLALLNNLEEIKFLDLLNAMDPQWSDKDGSVIPEEKSIEEPKP